MARRRHAVVHLVLQLRRSSGDLLGVPAARARDAPDASPARAARLGVRVGVRPRPRRLPAWWSIASAARRSSSAACTRGASSAWRRCCRAIPHLFLFRAAEGLGETFYFPASTSLISDYHGSLTRSRALGLHQTAVYMGTIGGGFFAGLIAERYGWRLVVRRVRRTRACCSASSSAGSSSSRRAARPSAVAGRPDAAPARIRRVPPAASGARRRCSACSAPSCARTSLRSCCSRGCRSSSSTASTWGWRWPA